MARRIGPHLPLEELKWRLHYDPETGVFTRRHWASNRHPAGERAGAIVTNGYRRINIDGTHYAAGVLAWFYMTGEWPEKEIDHKNTVRADDRWENLRLATRSQNVCNQKARGSTGLKGVSRAGMRFVAQIRAGGRTVYLGRFATAEAAHAAYMVAATHFFGEFARAA